MSDWISGADVEAGVAIVGMAGRFPGAATLAGFWRNLLDGVESITFWSEEELRAAGVPEEQLADPLYVRAKGVLADVQEFDAGFFGFTPREAAALDPQHRVFLECAWEALEDAGCDPQSFAGRIGLYAGTGASTYLLTNLLPAAQAASLGSLQLLLLNDRDFFATRASYKLDLKGPSVAVQTACSTSLVAVHMACQSLLSGECDAALAGGVSISTPLVAGYLYEEGGVVSPDGHCRAFDAAAAGSVEGNGCGVVVLKRLADALAAGDRVWAVIRGSAVNNDGADRAGFTAPSVEGQAAVIAESLLMAGVEPATIGYVEAHGSGTPLGDPIEVAALTQAFSSHRTGYCALGSVKASIGHCNTAAGIAGLIKTVLALAHRTLPPSLHFTAPNPQIDLTVSPFYVPTQALPWEAADGTPRRAGVSSFGLGGTNAHVVLEEAPARAAGEPPARAWQLLPLSAHTPAALDAAAERLVGHLEAHPEGGLEAFADIAWTLQVGRRGFEHRRAVVARNAAAAAAAIGDTVEAAAALRDGARAISGRREGAGSRPVVFLFPGLGDQYPGMTRELYEGEPAFRTEVDRCAEALTPLLGGDLRAVLFPTEPSPAPAATAAGPDLRALLRRGGGEEDATAARLRETTWAQPACFVVEYALARLLQSWGIAPQAMLGYSLGEYVAACVAGALTLDDALALIARRAKLIAELPAGAMLAVPLAAAEVEPLLAGTGLSLAATNGPHFSVVGGPEAAIGELAEQLAGRGVATLRLETTHAFHSADMEPVVAPFTAVARTVKMGAPRIPWVSNVTGTWITAADLAHPAYWARHMRGTVRFAEGLAELLAEPERVFLEVGPGGTLGTLVRQHPLSGENRLAVATLRRPEEARADVETLLAAVGRLWAAGVEVDWVALHGGERRRRVALPTYPFERRRCWIEPPAGPAAPAVDHADLADWLWVPAWKQVPRLAPAPPDVAAGGSWLLFLDRCGLGEWIAGRLRADGHAVATVAAGAGFAIGEEGAFTIDPGRRQDYDELVRQVKPARILHLWGVTAAEPGFGEAQTAGLLSLTLLVQALGGVGGAGDEAPPVRIHMVANGLGEVADGDPVHPAKATVLGAVKVVPQESARLACGSLDLGPLFLTVAPDPAELKRLVDRILAEALAGVEPAVALRGRQRWVRGFEPVRLTDRGASLLRADGAYLIADAAHGPGMALAEALVRAGAKVALTLPPQLPERARWESWEGLPEAPPGQDVIGTAIRRLLAIEAAVGLERVLIARAMPGDGAGLRAALAAARQRFGPLQGVFYTGGVFVGGLVQLKAPELLQATVEPVARGAAALLAAVAAAPEPPAFVVLSSSTLAVTGGLGQLDIAAAGAFLDALALRQAARGGPSILAVGWDPYQWDGWLIAGAAGGIGLAPEVEESLAALRIPAGRSAEALRRLLALAASGVPRAFVSSRDLPALIAETDSATAESLLAGLQPAHGGERAPRPGLSTPYAPPRDPLEEQLAEIWQELFGIAPIGVDDSFLELGGHSLLAIQLATRLRAACGVDLPITAVFEAPTVAELARRVRRARGEEDAAELDALLALVEGLSPEEAAAKLAELGVG